MKTLLTGLVLSLGIVLSADAQVLFSDDFQTPNDTVGSVPVDWNSTSNDTTLPGIGTTLVSNSGTPFSGAGNQYANIYDDLGSTNLYKSSLPSIDAAATVFAFDFYEPLRVGTTFDEGVSIGYTTAGGDINNSQGWTLAMDNGAFANISGGTTTTYSMGTAYRFYIAVNDTAASVNYTPLGLSTVSLAPGTAHVYFGLENGSTVSFAGSRSIVAGSLARLGFRTFTTGGQNVYIDDVSVSVIPEPAPAVMLLGGLGCLLGVRRARSRRV